MLRHKESLPVFGHPDIFLNRFREHGNDEKSYSGIPYTKGFLERSGGEFRFNKDFLEIGKCIFLTGEIPRESGFERADMENRFAMRDGVEIPDIIADEQALIINTKRGIIILTSCAHAGIVNTVDYSIEMTGRTDIFCLLGGTHRRTAGT